MKVGNLAAAEGILREATKVLGEAMEQSRTSWNDTAAERYQTEQLEPLLDRVATALRAMQHCGEAIRAAQRECSDPERDQ